MSEPQTTEMVPGSTPETTAPIAAPEAPSVPQQEAVAAAAAAPQYTPTYKYKVKDQEKEFDEIFRPVVKSPDLEAKLRDLYERADGLEVVKSERAAAKAELREFQEGLKQLNELRTKDFDQFLGALNIPQQEIYKWVLDKLNYQQLPPEQRAERDQFLATQRKAYTQEGELQMLRQQYEREATTRHSMEVDFHLSRPEVTAHASAIDGALGQGHFKQMVYEIGNAHFASAGQNLPVEQAVQMAVKRVQALSGAQRNVASPSAPVGTQPAAPTLPRVGGGGSSSPVGKPPRSIEDVEKYYQETYGRKA